MIATSVIVAALACLGLLALATIGKRGAFFTGGRPMIDQGFAFRDRVSGEDVHYWRDRYGREWMAVTAWASFRVPRSASPSTYVRDAKTWSFHRDR